MSWVILQEVLPIVWQFGHIVHQGLQISFWQQSRGLSHTRKKGEEIWFRLGFLSGASTHQKKETWKWQGTKSVGRRAGQLSITIVGSSQDFFMGTSMNDILTGRLAPLHRARSCRPHSLSELSWIVADLRRNNGHGFHGSIASRWRKRRRWQHNVNPKCQNWKLLPCTTF